MRKLILLPILLTCVIVFSFSCKKESRDTLVTSTTGETINVRIAPNQSYEMDLTNAGSVSIIKQAIHFSISEAIVNNEKGTQVYKYIPAKDFTGNDEVLLLSNKTEESHSVGNSGACSGSSSAYTTSIGVKYTTIKITVGN
jgi:hypothetical protein